MIIPFWLKIVGPIVLLLIVVGGVTAWGNSRYNAGVSDTDQKWVQAGEKLKAKAGQSATKADDAATERQIDELIQAKEDQEKVDAAKREGSSPLDALFGG